MSKSEQFRVVVRNSDNNVVSDTKFDSRLLALKRGTDALVENKDYVVTISIEQAMVELYISVRKLDGTIYRPFEYESVTLTAALDHINRIALNEDISEVSMRPID